jgi:hypothetical protein
MDAAADALTSHVWSDNRLDGTAANGPERDTIMKNRAAILPGRRVGSADEIAQAILMLMTNAYATGKMVYGDKGGRYVSPCPSNPTDDCRSDVIPTGAGDAHLSAVSAPEVTSHGPGT